MPDGLRTFSSTTLLPAALCRHFAFVNCVIWCATVLNWQTLPPARRTGFKIALLYQIYNLPMLYLILSARVQWKSLTTCFQNPDDKDFDFIPLLHGSMTGKVDSIRLAMDGIITEEQRQKMNIILCHYNEVKKCKADLESLIFSLLRALCQAMFSSVNCARYQKPFFCYRYNFRNRCWYVCVCLQQNTYAPGRG